MLKIKKYKLFIFFIIFFHTSIFASRNNWIFWERTGIFGDVNKNVSLAITQKNWFDKSGWTEIDFNQEVKLRVKGENFIGFDPEYDLVKGNEPGDYTRIFTPTCNIYNKFKIAKIGFNSTFLASFRFIEYQDYFAYCAFKINLDFLKYKNVTFYVNTKFYYNFHNLQKPDRNRSSFGARGKVNKHLELDFCYLLQKDKLAYGQPWQDKNILHLSINLLI
jgi:hypothetical protein